MVAPIRDGTSGPTTDALGVAILSRLLLAALGLVAPRLGWPSRLKVVALPGAVFAAGFLLGRLSDGPRKRHTTAARKRR
jgi:hypothetical protein